MRAMIKNGIIGRLRSFSRFVIKSFLLLIIGLLIIHIYVDYDVMEYSHNNIEEIPKNKVGLLLGTSKYVIGGGVNSFYSNRIKSAVELYERGKISKIIASGDNSTEYYNEPKKMKDDLIKNGIPEEDIVMDYAGFRTLDAVVRSKEVFGQNSITIISQDFHANRALFIARANNIDAISFEAESPSLTVGFKTYVREYFARVKMLLDLYVLRTEPKFYGPKISI
ncbi:MAG: hypothetical protein Kapaf2KO_14560 [Candidatus Kapaibacteriales bacterium]